MTTAYNKRPGSRGKVYEAQKRGSVSDFIKWVEPKTPFRKFLLTIVGFVPFVVLSILNWFTIERFGLSKFELLTSPEQAPEVFQFASIDEKQLETIQMIMTVSAGLLAVSFLLVLFSLFNVKSKARNPLAYLGFMFATASPLSFMIVTGSVNRLAVEKAIEPSVYAFLALLTALICLVYCVKYPVIVSSAKKRNIFPTRILTSLTPIRGDGIKESARKIVFTSALVCFAYFGSTLGVDLFNEWRAERDRARLEGLIGYNVDKDDPVRNNIRIANKNLKPLEEYLPLFKENNDMVGYIKIGDTKVNYPVVQTDNNKYYLDFDFYGNKSRGGAIYADTHNIFDGDRISDNTILYGHNITTGNYFAALSKYHSTTVKASEDLSFYKTNPVIRFDSMFERMEWKVFGVVLFNTQPHYGEVYRYWEQWNFGNEDEFHEFIFTVMDRSVLFTDVDLEYGDKILTLSTCYYPMGHPDTPGGVDSRVVIFARRVRPGESGQVDVEKAFYNKNVLRFTEEARRFGQGWKGERVWDYKKYLKSYTGA
ncbi:MAG: class B sortase [Oscillospiraceae bacterium]|nr:class B sortase [Oscillospiraceae bacterium]